MVLCGTIIVLSFRVADRFQWKYAPAGALAAFAVVSFIISETVIDDVAPEGTNWFVGLLAGAYLCARACVCVRVYREEGKKKTQGKETV